MKTIKMKIALLACFVMGMTALTAFGQASVGTGAQGTTYQAYLIPLPTLTLAAAGTTNFYFGYTNVTYSTNIQTGLYTNSLNGGSPGFYSVTNIFTNNAVTYPQVFFPKQERLSLEYHGNQSGSGASSTNTVTFTFAKSVTGLNGQEDTSAPFNWYTSVGATNSTCVTNIPADYIGGEGYLYLIAEQFQSTNSTLTNDISSGQTGPGIFAGIKPNAP
jgi:hypothetical protein